MGYVRLRCGSNVATGKTDVKEMIMRCKTNVSKCTKREEEFLQSLGWDNILSIKKKILVF